MDEDLRELAMILARNSAPKESALTIRWAVVIGLISVVCGFLFVGYVSNASRVSKMEARFEAREEYTAKVITDKEGHAVCVTRDRTKMVSNEQVVNLNPTCWEKEVMKYFGNKYTVVI